MIIDVFNYSLTAILIGVCATWVFLIKSMLTSFKMTPYLDDFKKLKHSNPKVSIILPARNEEEFLPKCLDTLIEQNYSNYEIIAIDDSSEDNTWKIISEYSKKNSKIIPVSSRAKPDGWMGKNWACMEGYKKATGELLLFTDADTKHSQNVVSLAVSHLLTFNLVALTVIPKMVCLDWWTKITLPMISTFLHTRFSAIRVNDPAKKTGYFFGSFFIITKKTYDEVGTHEGVKQEIIEDGALGKKVKDSGHKMKMVRGDHLIDAIWARDKSTLWNALKRLMIPLYLQSPGIAVGIFFAVLFLLFMPFPILAYSGILGFYNLSNSLVLVTSLIASILIYVGGITEVKKGLDLKFVHAVFAPIGSLVVVLGFLSGLCQAKKSSSVSWRGRNYSMKDHIQDSIRI
ncbi:MAG: glycosyltransferase family 2 protein [Nitrosopumilaceae archaeon]|jgi:cellulose synthase/poly-beta-1,6-N-acetylglucosamine synthase-like glycosyltransferase